MANEFQNLVSTTRLPVSTAEGLGRANAGLILGAVLAEGAISRAELADAVGLTRATVTRVVAKLIELGLLLEGSPRRDSPGRPMVPLTLAGGDRAVASIHFGTSEFRVGFVDLRGRVLHESRERYASKDPAAVVEAVSKRLRTSLTGALADLRLLGVGASIGGWVRSEPGEVRLFESLGWNNVPLESMLTKSLKLPVHLDQFVRGLALAEGMFGSARDMKDFIQLWVGNVIGVAIVEDGVVQSGTTGATGVISHFPTSVSTNATCNCGRTNCLEKAIGDPSVVQAAITAGIAKPGADVRDVVQLAESGNDIAESILRVSGSVAGEAAAAITNIVDPAGFVVAGVSTSAKAFWDEFVQAFETHALRAGEIAVRGSAFGDLAPTIASASVLLDAFYRDPLGFERLNINAE